MNPQKNRNTKHHKGRSAKISKTVALLVLFCLCIGGLSMVSARYIKQTDTKNNVAAAKDFYFESDLLDGQTHEIVPTENNGTTARVTVRLKNYADELRYAQTAIQYEVKVTEPDGATASGVSMQCITDTNSEDTTHTIAANAKHYADITLSGLKAGKTYTVTATTDNVYQKSLTGTIKVTEADKNVYAVVSNQTQYIEVTVWTTDYTGAVTVKYSAAANLVPDNTDTKMQNALTGDDITEQNWPANTSHVFRFFKENTEKNYKVAVNGTEVTVSEQ